MIITARYTSQILHRSWLSEDVFELKLEKPTSFLFRPGQHLRIGYQGIEREYSMISTTSEPALHLGIQYNDRDGLPSHLAACPLGSQIEFSGPLGHFIFRLSERPAVFVATGIGITPFLSMIRQGLSAVTLLHGVRHPKDLCYGTFINQRSVRYISCISGSTGGAKNQEGIYHGRVTDYMEKSLPRQATDFYLCGKRDMIRETTYIIDDLFPGSHVYTEIFF